MDLGSLFLRILIAGVCAITTGRLTAQPPTKTNEGACALCFYGPDNIAFDGNGNAFITDSDHKSRFRVLKVSAQGKEIDEWGVFPVVNGRKSGPEGIAIDIDGNILVIDGGRLRILKLSSAGKLLMSIGETASLFHDLGHIAIDSTGYIYVAEGNQNRIQKLSPDGKRAAVWQRPKGSGTEEWNRPETITIRLTVALQLKTGTTTGLSWCPLAAEPCLRLGD